MNCCRRFSFNLQGLKWPTSSLKCLRMTSSLHQFTHLITTSIIQDYQRQSMQCIEHFFPNHFSKSKLSHSNYSQECHPTVQINTKDENKQQSLICNTRKEVEFYPWNTHGQNQTHLKQIGLDRCTNISLMIIAKSTRKYKVLKTGTLPTSYNI